VEGADAHQRVAPPLVVLISGIEDPYQQAFRGSNVAVSEIVERPRS
jgi:hypothetical protein